MAGKEPLGETAFCLILRVQGGVAAAGVPPRVFLRLRSAKIKSFSGISNR
jgi:hypothetical protein